MNFLAHQIHVGSSFLFTQKFLCKGFHTRVVFNQEVSGACKGLFTHD